MSDTSRRTFVRDAARRAVYTTPLVLALSSRRAYAGASGCGEDGSVCYSDSDCCSGWRCRDAMGMMVKMGAAGTCQ